MWKRDRKDRDNNPQRKTGWWWVESMSYARSRTDDEGVYEVRSLLQVAMVHCVFRGLHLNTSGLQVHPHIKLELLCDRFIQR